MNKQTLSIGTWLSSGSPVVTELASLCGFDWLLLDMEHGCLTETELLQHLQVIRGTTTKPIVRIGAINTALITRVLDWGAAGIMLPHVSTPAQALACVRAMHYPPVGTRGYSSSARSYGYGVSPPDDPADVAAPLFLAQIEDDEGVRNAGAIAAVPGVDVLFVGPSDLQLNLRTRQPPQQRNYQEALKEVCGAAGAYHKQAGILVRDVSKLAALQQTGFSCLAIGSDLSILRQGFQELSRASSSLSKGGSTGSL